jgi:hypothetical protein
MKEYEAKVWGHGDVMEKKPMILKGNPIKDRRVECARRIRFVVAGCGCGTVV